MQPEYGCVSEVGTEKCIAHQIQHQIIEHY